MPSAATRAPAGTPPPSPAAQDSPTTSSTTTPTTRLRRQSPSRPPARARSATSHDRRGAQRRPPRRAARASARAAPPPAAPTARGVQPRQSMFIATRTWGSCARRASRCSTSSRVPGPRQATTGQPSRGQGRQELVALGAAQPPREVGHLRVGALGRERPGVVGQGVDDEHGQAAPVQRRGGRRRSPRTAAARARSRPCRRSRRSCSRSVGVVAQPGRPHPGEPAEDPSQVTLPGRRSRRPPSRPRSPAARPGRRGATKCSASADAARIVTSRLLAPPSTPPERPKSASASTTSSTPLSSSPREVTTWRSPVRSETRQLMRRSRSPAWKGRMPGELGAVADPARPVGADQAERLRRLGRAVERRRRRQHASSRRRARAPAPSGSPPTGWSARPSPRPASGGPTAAG